MVELFQAVFFQYYICKRERDGKISISQVCCRWLFSFSITATVVLLFLFLLNTKILLIVHPCHDDTSLSDLGNFVTHDAKKGWTGEQGKKLKTTISLDIYCSLQVSPSGPGLEIIAGSRFAKRFEGRRRWGGGSGLRHVFPNSRGFVFPEILKEIFADFWGFLSLLHISRRFFWESS